MRDEIYTLGYQRRTVEEFVAIAKSAGVKVVIDVRETAWSHKPGFSKGAFQNALDNAGIEYVHASFAGNPKWIRDAATTHEECLEWYEWYLEEFVEVMDAFEALVGQILAGGKSLALTCFERHSSDCHRSILAQKWADRSRRRGVTHLSIDGCERISLVYKNDA